MFEGVTQQLAKSVTTIKYDDLPQEVVEKIKLMLLDSIGCALAGHITDRGRIALELVEEFGGNPQASIIGNHRTSYTLAAFINSELINALDYDYDGPLTGHVGPYVTSPCLAMAEREHASGEDFILALALANEIGGRVTSSLAQHYVLKEEPPYYEESPHFSQTSTIFGGVAGTGKLLGLDVNQLSNAFGIAGASTAVPAQMKWQHLPGPAIMTKYNCWTGWLSQLATVAALLAKKGYTGDKTILDGEWGYWKIVGSPFFKVERLFEGLGEVWHIEEVDFKLYPVCRINSAAVDGINQLMQEHEIKPQEIENIVVKGPPMGLAPLRVGMEMESFADIQFRNTYITAVAVYYGRSPSPAWQMPAIYNSPEVKAMAEKVKTELHPRASEITASRIKVGKLPIFWDQIVEITARGKKFIAEIPIPKGSPGNPVSKAELVEKFRVNAAYSRLKSSKTEQIVQMIDRLDKVADVTELTRLTTVI